MNGDEVAEALRHLLAFDLQEAVVHPDVGHPRGIERAAGLRDLVLVMRKDEIDSAAVDVEGVLARVVAGDPRRTARAASPSTSPSIRYASRGAPAPRCRLGSASPARSASTASTGRSPSGRACKARRRRARRPASRRANGWRARRSAARPEARPSRKAKTARDPRRHRRRRGRRAARSSRASHRYIEWRAARGSAAARRAPLRPREIAARSLR